MKQFIRASKNQIANKAEENKDAKPNDKENVVDADFEDIKEDKEKKEDKEDKEDKEKSA